MDERARRIWAAAEARELGYGGVSLVAGATGISRTTIHGGLKELAQKKPPNLHRVRQPGGGRKALSHHCPDFSRRLENLVEPLTRGDPESALRWTCKSVRQLADALNRQSIPAGRQSVAHELHRLKYSLQGNLKIKEGAQHPDRNAQFEYINRQAQTSIKRGSPVISVDTKKKEMVGNYRNGGREWHGKGKAPAVNTYDFPDALVPRAYPYGVYALKRNEGFVNVGSDRDTSAFAVASIRAWWSKVGSRAYPKARHIQVMADGGGSNGCNRRVWKWELQRLADDTGLPIRVCHFPPGTSKWNKVEHRLFSFISQNWRGKPLTSHETIVKLIASTTTREGLKVHCELDHRKYPLKQKVSDEEWNTLNLRPMKFHGEWNYKIQPRVKN